MGDPGSSRWRRRKPVKDLWQTARVWSRPMPEDHDWRRGGGGGTTAAAAKAANQYGPSSESNGRRTQAWAKLVAINDTANLSILIFQLRLIALYYYGKMPSMLTSKHLNSWMTTLHPTAVVGAFVTTAPLQIKSTQLLIPPYSCPIPQRISTLHSNVRSACLNHLGDSNGTAWAMDVVHSTLC